MAPLPAGPRGPVFAQTVAYHRDPLRVLRQARRAHGRVFTMRLALKEPLVVADVPGELDGWLRSDGDRAHAGAARRVILPLASPDSPFGADGDTHRAIRALMAPAFTAEAAAAMRPAIAGLAAQHAERWPRGRPMRLLPRMRTLASDVFVRLVLRVDDHERATALVLAIRRMLLTPGNPPLTVPGRGDPVLGPALDAAFRRRLAPVAAVLEQEIADHRAGRRSGEGLLGRLAATDMPAAEIVDRLTVVVAAAQEPGSIGMTNVLYEIARRPGLDERFLAADEADREAIVHEALRLRPVAQASLRRLTEAARIDGHDLPADTVLALPSLLLHRDPAAFPEPDAFRPERFAGGAPSGAPFFPFGRGVRSCIGEPVARAELAAAVPAILERLRLTAAWPRPEKMVVRGTVLVPHRSALVRARRR